VILEPDSEVFLTIAELCLALIGFSGVVSIFGRRNEGRWTADEILRLRTLVEPALTTLAGCFVPILLVSFFEDQVSLWRVSNACLIAIHMIAFVLFWIRAKANAVTSQKVMTMIFLAIVLIQILSVAEVVDFHVTAFLLGLLIGVAISIHNFYLLLFETNLSQK
jgi:hypothetical protein